MLLADPKLQSSAIAFAPIREGIASIAERLSRWLIIAIVMCLPFEIRVTPPYPSQLQVLFLLLLFVALPVLIRDARAIVSKRIVIAVLLFAAVQWICALLAPDFGFNTVKAAWRYTAGAALVCVFAAVGDRKQLLKAWSIASIVAAIYGLIDYAGFGFPGLFRDAEFYFQLVQRLSGSFEYANTAAAYYAMSLPIVWTTATNRSVRVGGCALLWSTLVLTLSRGALVALLVVLTIWFVSSRSIKALQLAGLGALVYLGFAINLPVLFDRASRPLPAPQRVMSVDYQLQFNHISEKPGTFAEMSVVLRNTGPDEWPSSGQDKVALAYHWYSTAEKRIVNASSVETPISHDVPDNQSVTLKASFRTPEEPGFYLLSWDLKTNHEWFSKFGVPVAVVEADIRPDADGARTQVDLSRWYPRRRGIGLTASADLPRQQLWRAALALAESKPLLGVGPDNFRMMYGSVLGFGKWDTNLHSNSLYLELLAGSGIVGLLSFLFLLSRVRWKVASETLALGVSIVQGVVDFFLMTTPIYFGFWLLIGCASSEANESRV